MENFIFFKFFIFSYVIKYGIITFYQKSKNYTPVNINIKPHINQIPILIQYQTRTKYPNLPSVMQDTQSLQDTIRQQIQFYLNPANLLTDFNLLKQLTKQHSWIPITYFLKCHKIQQLMSQLDIENKNRKKRLSKILQKSVYLKISNWRVKARNKFSYKRQYKKLIYAELGQQSSGNTVKKQIQYHGHDNMIKINFKASDNWIFVIPEHSQQKIENYMKQNTNKLGITKMLNSQQWAQEQARYEKITLALKKIRKQSVNQQQQNLNNQQ